MEGITRREFIKKAAVVGAGLGVSVIAADYLLKQASTALPEVSLREALFYEGLGDNIVRCALCPNRCVIADNGRGLCGVRMNKGGKLYTLGYGNPCAAHLDPIEKKPLFHFLPSTNAFSIATAGCCLRCKYCQNWQISQAKPDETQNLDLSPEDVVAYAKRYNARSIAYTYTEPTVFYEYMLDTAKLAKEEGIKNVIVSCGYINPEPLKGLCRFLDAGNVNLKGFSNRVYRSLTEGSLQPILDSIIVLKEENKWFELTYLVIPGWSDDYEQIKAFVDWVVDNIGVNHPVHFLRFRPAYKLSNLAPTPAETLKTARNMALDSGLRYVYVGNLPGLGFESTYCPSCKNLLIERQGFYVVENRIEDGRCKNCGEGIHGFWG
ncbi:MAG: AmmeMemoRadiSam system radical SAM enzyme [Candidatus Altiarchaeota archaeon]|nr:AmmeMemoRadiSam system radical SAM enzyme [Candidatus Altiarchaeota archaeon]